jgi:hypothetical protein
MAPPVGFTQIGEYFMVDAAAVRLLASDHPFRDTLVALVDSGSAIAGVVSTTFVVDLVKGAEAVGMERIKALLDRSQWPVLRRTL